MIEDQFALSLIGLLLIALRLHAVAGEFEAIPTARLLRMGYRLRRFVAFEELRATLRRKFPPSIQTTHPRWSLSVPMPERPDRRYM